MKKFDLGIVNVEMHPNKFVKGFILKRNLTTKECKYIMRNLLGIDIKTKEDCYDIEEYKEYNEELTNDVNDWLRGETDDSAIMEYAFYCSD